MNHGVRDKAAKSFLYICWHYSTSARQLAEHLGCTSKQAMRWLRQWEQELPIRVRVERVNDGKPEQHFILDPKWRKRHKFI